MGWEVRKYIYDDYTTHEKPKEILPYFPSYPIETNEDMFYIKLNAHLFIFFSSYTRLWILIPCENIWNLSMLP